MEREIVLYLLKANLAIVLLAGLYRLVMQNDREFNIRRGYLLIGVMCAFLFQFIPSPLAPIEQSAAIANALSLPTISAANIQSSSVNVWMVTLAVWGSVSLVILLKMLYAIFAVVVIRLSSVSAHLHGTKVFIPKHAQGAFTLFGWVFIPKEEMYSKNILCHELSHRNGLHSVDILVSELLRLVLWMNPAAWYLRAIMRENLEFIADRAVIESGVDKRSYQYELLDRCLVKEKSIVATYFNNSKLKNRIIMMNKQSKSPLGVLKYGILPIMVLALSLTNARAVAQTELSVSSNADSVSVYIDGEISNINVFNKIDPNQIESVAVDNSTSPSSMIVTTREAASSGDVITVVGAKQPAGGAKQMHNELSVVGSSFPLVIIDGKEADQKQMNALNPEDIESINVLKKESATNKYGSKAVNGVIEVILK